MTTPPNTYRFRPQQRSVFVCAVFAGLFVCARGPQPAATFTSVMPSRPAILFRTKGSEAQWLVVDVPVVNDNLFSGGTVMRITTPVGSQLDTLVDEALVTHDPQAARPAFSQQLYFLRNSYPTSIESALERGIGISIDLRAPGAGAGRIYQQADHSLVVNRHPVDLDRGLSISSSTRIPSR